MLIFCSSAQLSLWWMSLKPTYKSQVNVTLHAGYWGESTQGCATTFKACECGTSQRLGGCLEQFRNGSSKMERIMKTTDFLNVLMRNKAPSKELASCRRWTVKSTTLP